MFKQQVGALARRPHIIAVDASVTQAADLMGRAGLSCLAAVRGARVVGFVTEDALVGHFDVDIDSGASIRELLLRPEGAIPKDTPVSEAVRLLLERGVRHLPVVDFGGSLLGIVTDKELVDALAVDFMVENAICNQVMRRDAVAVLPETTIRNVLGGMRARNTDCVLVVRANKPVGIFSDRDVLTRIMSDTSHLNDPISHHMSKPVVSVPATAMLYKVILYMRQKNVRRVAVVGDGGGLAGLLTQRDILTYARHIGL